MLRRAFLSAVAGGGVMAAYGASSQEARRKQLYELLGDLPPRRRKIQARTLWVEARPAYVLEKLELDLNGIELVPACRLCTIRRRVRR